MSGLAGGSGRALVFLGFSTALVAIAAALFAVDALPGRAAAVAAAAATVLCATIVVPGVVDENDLDAKPVNALAAAGDAIALVLTLLVARRYGSSFAPPLPGDRARVAAAALVVLVSLPWVVAELGFYLDVPGVLSEEVRTQPDDPEPRAAVHLGHHHGFDGTLLTLAALVLSRRLRDVRRPRLRSALATYLALMLVYGLWNIANDAWLEQIVKRGWTEWMLPDVTRPGLTAAWALLLAIALAVRLTLFRARPRFTADATGA